ncbi:Metallo-hydrolase/oxidoreductase [Sarocladium strictum]
MCQLPIPSAERTTSAPSAGVKPAFSCRRHNRTTFVLQEDDKWGEQPLIYAKLYPRHIVVIDSGCGGSLHSPGRDITLRRFLETVPVADNGDQPLNPSGKRQYTLICTHCHYDHIAGIPEFMSAPAIAVWASQLGRSYMTDSAKFVSASLCCYVGMPLPEFTVTNWANDSVHVTASGESGESEDLGLVIYQTPGHMPDEVAIWDAEERYLYVGDTMYQHAPILFPEGGSFLQYGKTLERLQTLIREWNCENGLGQVKLSAGHLTEAVDAATFVEKVAHFYYRVMRSEVMPVQLEEACAWFGGQQAVVFKEGEDDVQFMGLKTSFEQLA